MTTLIWLNRLAFALLFLGAVSLAFALTLQPKVSDDWDLLWSFQRSSGSFDWVMQEYTQITGRIWIILLTAFVLPHPFVEVCYRAFIVVEIVLVAALAWYCAFGSSAWRRTTDNLQAMAIFGTLLWFALPDRSETVAWMVGNFAYVVSALFGLAFIAWLERSATRIPAIREIENRRSFASCVVAFLLGFSAGISHEQIVAACVTYLALTILPVSRRFLLDRRPPGVQFWVGATGLALGTVVLVSAPGNFVRMSNIAAPGLLSIVERMALFIPGAFFELGTDATGKYIWLGAAIFTLLFFDRYARREELLSSLKRGIFWWIVSLVSLLAMAPATNFISTRTTFFAIIFFYVGFAAMTSHTRSEANDASDDLAVSQKAKIPRLVASTSILTILAFLVVVEGLATLISNASVAAEVAKREAIVKRALLSPFSDDKSPIRVPFISTQPAALTFMLNPEHDAVFLGNWGSAVGRKIEHDVSPGSPLPYSSKPLKTIKFRNAG